jgi:3-hydroxyisobutyrate dehydrogenase-like beta-hydroxyacid dehydrogenase
MNNESSTQQRRIAVLGTGKMGGAIAGRFSEAGFEVVLWNRTQSRARALGFGTVADTPAAAARDADIVVSSLTGPAAVRAAYLGPDGALTGGEGKRFVEMSTAGPELVSELAVQVAAAGSTLIDAPILGAPPVVRAGQATILVSGDVEDTIATRPVLSVLGLVRHVGPLGNAARLKLVANSMLADIVLAAAELQAGGEQAGLDADDVFWVLQRLAPALEVRRAGFVESHYTPALFALRDLRKDLELAVALFVSSGAETPITSAVRDLVGAAATLTPDFDISAVARRYRKARSSPTPNAEPKPSPPQPHDEAVVGAAMSGPRTSQTSVS